MSKVKNLKGNFEITVYPQPHNEFEVIVFDRYTQIEFELQIEDWETTYDRNSPEWSEEPEGMISLLAIPKIIWAVTQDSDPSLTPVLALDDSVNTELNTVRWFLKVFGLSFKDVTVRYYEADDNDWMLDIILPAKVAYDLISHLNWDWGEGG